MDIFQIYLVLTLSCNLECPHCIRTFTKKPKGSIEYEKILELFNEIHNKIPNVQIILTGGEPSIHKDFLKIVNLAISKFSKVYICSNGIIEENILEELCSYKNIVMQISLDGEEFVHDSIRGCGSFSKSINTIKKLIENKIAVNISTTVNKDNIESIYKLANVLNEFDIKAWQIEMEQTFSIDENKKRVSIEEWNSFVDNIIHITKNKLTIKKLFDFNLFEKMEKILEPTILNRAIKNCGFCSNKIYIYPDFSVRACTCMDDLILGNLLNDSIFDILNNMKEKKKLIEIQKDSVCYTCRWKNLCNGGCPGYSLFFNNKFGYGDIRCPKIRDYYANK